ncbi:MAG: LptF/LptG family permease [Mariprofundaceae bacterium]|nr:LptF/LptG family permease [Mariprofundaceae bacterium]
MVLDRYIFKLWFGPFVGMLLVVTGVLLLGRVLKLLGMFADKGVEWGIMLTMLMAILPYFLVLTVPMAFFFAMQAMILKLYENSEMDALRAAGLSYVRIFRSLFVVAVVLWLGLTFTALQWMPQGQKTFQGFLLAVQEMKPAPGFEPLRFSKDLEDFTVYVRGVDDEGVFQGFMLEDRRSQVAVVYMAESARLERVGGDLRFTLFHGTRLEGEASNLRSLAFDRYQIAMNLNELGLLKAPRWRSRVFELQAKELWELVQNTHRPDAVAEWHRRLIMPMSILVLMLLCLPLSHTSKRSSKTWAYIAGVGLILFIYNLQVILHQQVLNGSAPWWLMWLGQGILLLLSLVFFWRSNNDKPLALGGLMGSFRQFRCWMFLRQHKTRK